ncbi:MAG: energy transducer TonB [Sulfuricurvum sp.]|nr:energy transducer TonB [Sulfuricurvum sp.]
MISQLRPLFFSLFIHIFLLVLFIFAFTYTPKKESRTSLKLQTICSCSTPATLPKKQTPAQPTKEIKSIPVQKSTPMTPVIQKVPTHLQTVQPTPTVAPQPIARPSISVPTAVPLSPPAEIPKTVHQPIAPSVNIEKEFLDAHLGEIRALLIQNLKYPRNAQRLKMQGEVRISFRLKSDGSVENIEVVKSSGFEILDEDAKALIKNTAPQFPKPSKSISLSIPMSYLLR